MTSSEDRRPAVEIVRPGYPRGPFRAVVFDFDGTLSLLRRNWQEVMIPMFVEILAGCDTDESPDELRQLVEDFVTRLTGRQTIYQMIRLAEEVQRRGGTPCPPLQYKHDYHTRLWQQVSQRIDAVRRGEVSQDDMCVPGARELLDALRARDLDLYLASGTDLDYVRDELDVLGLSHYFGNHVYGALDDYQKFSKAKLIATIVRDTGVTGDQLIGIGDGYVEIEEIKRVGGLAIGVASNEVERCGINTWKRKRLIEAGADLIISDYRCLQQLLHATSLDQRPIVTTRTDSSN